MLAMAESPIPYVTKPPSKLLQTKGRETQAKVKATLSQALELKELAFKTAKAIQIEPGSLSDSQEARAVAQAVTSLCKAFADMVTIIRIERGKPLPGSLRPESKAKPKKAKPNTFTEE